MSRKFTLILGGARSGKTRYAQRMAMELGGCVVYVATAEAGDDEMRERIAQHRAARPATWQTLERALRVGDALRALDADVVIVDCVTLLVSNVLLTLGDAATVAQLDAAVQVEIAALVDAWCAARFQLIVVSNEVGMGLVPPFPIGRIYRDALGRANQQLAQSADEVLLLVAGLPLRVK